MRIGIVSDSHNNRPNLASAIEMLKDKGIDMLIHCGDLVSPFMLDELALAGVHAYLVAGNVDSGIMLKVECEKFANITFFGEIGKIVADGKKIGFCHYPHIAKDLAGKGGYAAVFFGHTHRKSEERVGKTLLLNPGEAAGKLSDPSCAVYDTARDEAEFFFIS